MSEIDLSRLPPLLPADVRRVFFDADRPEKNGLPTDAQLDQEAAQDGFYKTSVVALDKKLTTVASQTDANSAAVTTEAQARTDADTAEAAARQALAATVSTNAATVESNRIASVDRDNALAADISTLSTTVAGNTASITTATTSINGIAARYTLQATLNNTTGGYEFAGVQRTDGTGPVFSMAFKVNDFSLTDPAYNGGLPNNVFNYSAGYFTFNVPVTINGALIVNGTITATQVAPGTATVPYWYGFTAAQRLGTGTTSSSGVVYGTAQTVSSDYDFIVDFTFNFGFDFGTQVSHVTLTLFIDGVNRGTIYDAQVFGAQVFNYVKKTRLPAGSHSVNLNYGYSSALAAGRCDIIAGSELVIMTIKR